ncbi:hypothetical protein Bbad01_31490 [Bacillus badius]|nr:hypothetical protein Bbad01_31490 [Bacillus badius]
MSRHERLSISLLTIKRSLVHEQTTMKGWQEQQVIEKYLFVKKQNIRQKAYSFWRMFLNNI